jgi:hypothetical protein
MSGQRPASLLGRVTVLVGLMIATLGFGAAGLCGAYFTFSALPAMFRHGPENYAGAVLIIGLPSLLIGGGLAWWCVRALCRLMGDDSKP